MLRDKWMITKEQVDDATREILEFLRVNKSVGEQIPATYVNGMLAGRAVMYRIRKKFNSSTIFLQHLEHKGLVRIYEERNLGSVGRPKKYVEIVEFT
ncbi:hypothetical protein SEA_FORZA_193 [Gordonia phage Forza]|uniref:Uncharacterized protein n=1 Tax=Gordonia phage Forza TaxID=2571247 RepID=A0A650EYM6_9CAUD|nr:hypothetical protein PP303_gp135 [Gordonia phage Forza]QGT55154.1 hypothetical protein SEA_FORZA_193 [Gordonia phage Forza]